MTGDVLTEEQIELAAEVRDLLATYRDAEDLIAVGAYKSGTSPRIDRAMAVVEELRDFLKQRTREVVSAPEAWERLVAIVASARAETTEAPATDQNQPPVRALQAMPAHA